MEAAGLMCALRRHTAESLLELGKTTVEARWVARAPGMYQPLFTLRPVELAACAGALLDERDPTAATAPLAEHDITWGAAFAPRGDGLLPIAAAGVPTVRALRRLGVEVATNIAVARLLDAVTSFVFVGTGHGGGSLVWRDGPLLLVRRLHDRADLVRALGRVVAPAPR